MNALVLEKKANEFRSKWGLGSNDSINLKGFLYKSNVLTVFRPLSDKLSGMALKVETGDDVNRFILINSNKTLGHQHFTICHELYHLFVQENFKSMACSAGRFERRDKEEFNADVFAANLLLPENGVKALIPDSELDRDKIRLSTILRIEHYFSCSRSALLYRLKDLRIISPNKYLEYREGVKRSAVEFGYTTRIYESGNHNEVIGDYGTLAKELYDQEKISESHYYSLLLDLGMNSEQLENNEDGEEG